MQDGGLLCAFQIFPQREKHVKMQLLATFGGLGNIQLSIDF
jgi:hypothetical protein